MPQVSVIVPPFPFIDGIPSSIYPYDPNGVVDFKDFTRSTINYVAYGGSSQIWGSSTLALTMIAHPTSTIVVVTPPASLFSFLKRLLVLFFPGSPRASSGKLSGNLQNPANPAAEPIMFGPVDVAVV